MYDPSMYDPYEIRESRRPHLKSFIIVLLILEAALITLYGLFFFIFSLNMTEAQSDVAVAAESEDPVDEEGTKNASKLKTAKVATLDDVTIRATVAPKDMTGILFHQASYEGLNVMSTKLQTADATKALKSHSLSVNKKQEDLTGWADAEALHLYRQGNTQEMNTSIDIGGKAGCNVYAPVTGTVVLVKKYQLYGQYADYRIHIQPKGHPEYDCVILHCKSPSVKAGDKVTAGVTKIAKMRDIAAKLSGIQLADYTKEGGNHSHIQIGNANDSSYRDRVMDGAIKVKE